jgi:pantoate--beta-alanine ligase
MASLKMETATTVAAVRERVARWRAEGQRVAFVPTMGNLHAGHISLIELARKRGDRFVASIFVNPMQFGPNEDYAHYPRTPDKDERMLADAGCDLMFMPDVAEIYPRGFEHDTRVAVPELSGVLDGEFRPGHFDGVSTVVAKLFNIVTPDIAVFGEKDFQQLAIIRRMVADLCVPIEIIGAPTVREKDGLAMSSRNQYLTEEERAVAPRLFEALMRAVGQIERGERNVAGIEQAELEGLKKQGFRPDYFTVRDANTLTAPDVDARHLVVLVAARLGKARLIDNLQLSR